MTITLRTADLRHARDAAAVVEMLNAYASDPRGGGAPLPDDVQARLVPALRDHPCAFVLLAFDGERPVGVAVCFVTLSTFQARPLVNIHDLAVVPEARGQGVGRALLAAIEERATALGCCKLTLEVQEQNTPARTLYASVGFEDFLIAGSATRFLAKPLGPTTGPPSPRHDEERRRP